MLHSVLSPGKNDPLFYDDKSSRSSDDDNENNKGSKLKPGMRHVKLTFSGATLIFHLQYKLCLPLLLFIFPHTSYLNNRDIYSRFCISKSITTFGKLSVVLVF